MTVVGAIGVTLLDYPVLRFGPEGLDWIYSQLELNLLDTERPT